METIKNQLQQLGFFVSVSEYDANTLVIMNWNHVEGFDEQMYRIKVGVKSTLATVLAKMQCKSEYKSFVEKFASLIKFNSAFLYPTTYGIGVFVYGENSLNVSRIQAEISSVLNSRGIDFKNEMSDESMVLRFKISKAKSNLARI